MMTANQTQLYREETSEVPNCLLKQNSLLEECFNESKDLTAIFMEKPEDILNPTAINPAFLPIIVTHAVTFFVGICGNCVVIATWAGRGKLRSPTASFLVSLAAADLLLLLVYIPLETLEYFVITWDKGGSVCKLSCYVEMLSGVASVLNLVAVSIERFLVIVYPIKARRFCTISTSRKGLILVWSSAVLLAVPVLFTKHIYPITYYNNSTSLTAFYCWDSTDDWAFIISIYQLLVMFLFPALLMVLCYFCVIQELWLSTKAMASMTNASRTQSVNSGLRAHRGGESYVVKWPSGKHEKTESNHQLRKAHSQGHEVRHARKQVIKMLIFVVVIFLLCWGPRLIMNVIIKMGLNSYTHFTYNARIACTLLSFVHSALNPFVYGFMSSNFRRMLCKTCNKRNSNNSLPTEHHYLSSIKNQSQRTKYSDIYDSTAILGNGIVVNKPSNLLECSVFRSEMSVSEWDENKESFQ